MLIIPVIERKHPNLEISNERSVYWCYEYSQIKNKKTDAHWAKYENFHDISYQNKTSFQFQSKNKVIQLCDKIILTSIFNNNCKQNLCTV